MKTDIMPHPSDTYDEEVPVLIIGGGPCGLLLAFMLDQLGIQSLIAERYPTRLAAPKAHALSPRSLELSRQFGLDINEIRKIGSCRDDAFWVNFVTNLAGVHAGRLPYERMDPEVLEYTSAMVHNIPQPCFEEFIARRLSKGRNAEIRKNHSFVSVQQFDDYVITTIEDRSNKQLYKVKSKHLVACDGAKSSVRKYMDVEMDGEDSYETMMTIHFNADLRPVVKENVGMLHWIMDPLVSGFIISYDLSGNQVLICNFDSEKYPIDSWDEQHCRDVLDAAIGTQVKYDVLSFRPWILSRKVANSYRVGRVFLAGDAANAFPPTGGLGLNSGLGDVHNLAYKLAAVHHGWGGDAVLDTYHEERRQVAQVNSQQSLKNGKKIFRLLKAFGATHPDLDGARRNLHTNIRNPKLIADPEEGIEGQREHFDNLGLHIGYVYGDKRIPDNASVFEPVCTIGARLPHAWINLAKPEKVRLPAINSSYVREFSAEQASTKRFSTLDLCRYDSFTVIVDESNSAQVKSAVEKALEQLAEQVIVNLPLQVVVQGLDFTLQQGQEKWIDLTRLPEGHSILVRPDQHVLSVFDKHVEPLDLVRALEGHLKW